MNPLPRALTLLVLLPLTTGACSLRYAHHQFGDAALNDARASVPLEGGLRVWHGPIGDGTADFQAIGTYQRLDYFTDAVLNHAQVRARYFPLAEGSIRPFVGGGGGFMRLERNEGGIIEECSGRRICLGPGLTESRDAVARFNPHVVVGAELTREERPGSIVFSVTRELMASVDDWALNAWRISLGLAFRPR